jgi:hypothetical protein
MAKHIVKANRTGNQVRITLPILLLKEMDWKDVSYFVLKKVDTYTISAKELFRKEDMECK